ncbi:hypothetical protein [Merismopedia glauca]|nr:hypothetical protein [Merismopedia glauca]
MSDMSNQKSAFCFPRASFCFPRTESQAERPSVQLQLEDLSKSFKR